MNSTSVAQIFLEMLLFTQKKTLEDLLSEIDKLRLKKPFFVKMPISNSTRVIKIMLDVIAKHSSKGVIFGNLQKDRSHPSLIKSEVIKFRIGNFSGKPTFERSNELIKFAHKNYKKRFAIIGCGGVFSAQDAYVKIKKGASLVQLITGMIFEGPQLIHEINSGLVKLLAIDGFKNIADAVGVDS